MTFDILIYITILIVGLFIVIKSANVFVDNIVIIGKLKGISEIVLGVTTAAVGTSLPEFGSTMIAVLTGNVDIGLGTALGSNIWNIGGILGITALIAGTIICKKKDFLRDGSMTLITTIILFIAVSFFNKINRITGIILVIVYLIYLYILIKTAEKEEKEKEKIKTEEHPDIINKISEEKEETKSFFKLILYALVGIVGLVVGCNLLVSSMTNLSALLSIPQIISGLILGVATSIPELVTAFTSVRKGLNSLAIGTVLGSNTFNIMIGLGLPALITDIPVELSIIQYDIPMVLGITVLLLILGSRGYKINKKDGFIIFAFYIIYCIGKVYFLG